MSELTDQQFWAATIALILTGSALISIGWFRWHSRPEWDAPRGATSRVTDFYLFHVLKTNDFWYVGLRGYGYSENGWEIKRHIVRRLKKKRMATRTGLGPSTTAFDDQWGSDE